MNPRNLTTKHIARALLVAAALAIPAATLTSTPARAEVIISVGFAPPPLPIYSQPYCPGDGYLWTPGYWAYNDIDGYYWVPGTWILPPRVGYLWTPAYWGWEGGRYRFYNGYWGPHIGYYGGINYGFGYIGHGYEGGYWSGPRFYYNQAVNRFESGRVTNVYNRPVNVYNTTPRQLQRRQRRHSISSFPAGADRAARAARPPTTEQFQHEHFAAQNPQQRFNTNHGNPAVVAAATPRSFQANPHDPNAAARPIGNERINDRVGNQQQRIANGVNNGQMTSGEAARADQRQANIDRTIHNDRAANGGQLTQQQRQQVQREQNNASQQIYRENHNANTANPNNPVNNREANQQQRIANGVNNGQMTPGEAARADQRQANIDRQVRNDRTTNGGTMTQQERQQTMRDQNRASQQIYRENRNAVQPQAQPQPRPQPQAAPQPRPQPQAQPRPQPEARPAAPAGRPEAPHQEGQRQEGRPHGR